MENGKRKMENCKNIDWFVSFLILILFLHFPFSVFRFPLLLAYALLNLIAF